jgi:diguanylate cyclase (GGDEF)-like protein
MQRPRLRSRVLLLTTAFGVALFAVAFGMSWRERAAQERWSRLVGVEMGAIADLDELVRAQNAFHARVKRERSERDAPHPAFGTPLPVGEGVSASPAPTSVSPLPPGEGSGVRGYRIVSQWLQRPSLATPDLASLRSRVKAYAATLADPTATGEELDGASLLVVASAQRVLNERKREVAAQLPELQRDARDTMSAGLAIVWILVISSFAAVQITLRSVVRPIEELSVAAERIASGDLNARAPVAGDREIAKLGVAFNRMADELKARARTDELTNMPNFRAFRERIDGEIDRAQRYPETFGILVLDLDRFKKYNDSFGHLAGNDALKRVAQSIRDSVRSVDFPARYGGEEFAVIVPQVDVPALLTIAERVREGIEAIPAPPDGASITVSIGAALFPSDGANVDALFQVADERLYAAKKGGRNRVVGGVSPPVPAVRSGGRSSA